MIIKILSFLIILSPLRTYSKPFMTNLEDNDQILEPEDPFNVMKKYGLLDELKDNDELIDLNEIYEKDDISNTDKENEAEIESDEKANKLAYRGQG